MYELTSLTCSLCVPGVTGDRPLAAHEFPLAHLVSHCELPIVLPVISAPPWSKQACSLCSGCYAHLYTPSEAPICSPSPVAPHPCKTRWSSTEERMATCCLHSDRTAMDPHNIRALRKGLHANVRIPIDHSLKCYSLLGLSLFFNPILINVHLP